MKLTGLSHVSFLIRKMEISNWCVKGMICNELSRCLVPDSLISVSPVV